MKNQKTILLVGIITVVGIIAYYLYPGTIVNNGKEYSSKATLCRQFAQDYLKTVQKTDTITDLGSDKWNMAVDVETDLYNLCLIDLNKESLKNYKTTSLEKYQK